MGVHWLEGRSCGGHGGYEMACVGIAGVYYFFSCYAALLVKLSHYALIMV